MRFLLTYLSRAGQVNEQHCIFVAFAVSLCAFDGKTAIYIEHMNTIPDFTESQIWTVTSTLKEHFKEGVELLLAQADHDLKQREEADKA